MSVAKLGTVIRFIPTPVIMGFTAGIGVTIWVGQWPYFFGFPPLPYMAPVSYTHLDVYKRQC